MTWHVLWRFRTASDKILLNKEFDIPKNPKYDGYQRGLASMVYNFFYQRTSGGAITNENITNKELAEESQKQIIEKLNERKAHSSFTDNIWGAFSADVELISKFNKGIRYLLCVFDIFSKYTWVIHLNDEKGITISNAFQKKLNLKASNRKPNKMWEHKESEFYDRSMRSFLQNNNIEIYSTHNEGKSAVV